MRMSLASISTSTSSASGSTATVIADVCTRPCCSVTRHALHAMHAALVFQLAVDALAAHQRDDFLEPAHRRLAHGREFHAPALRFGIARVHAENLGREQRGLVAARARADFEHHVLLVVGILGQQQDLQLLLDLHQSRAPAARFLRCAICRISASESDIMARACASWLEASFHSRYLATISDSSLWALAALRY